MKKREGKLIMGDIDFFFHQGGRKSYSLKRVTITEVFSNNLNTLSGIFKISFSECTNLGIYNSQ